MKEPQTILQKINDWWKYFDQTILDEVVKVICESEIVITAGNGGSSSIASHLTQAIMKPQSQLAWKPSICLTDNIELLTAWSNDENYENAMLRIFDPFGRQYQGKGVLIIFSSSGESLNVCNLLYHAKKYQFKTIGITGFGGGYIRKHCDFNICLLDDSYEVVESAHLMIVHMIQEKINDFLNSQNRKG